VTDRRLVVATTDELGPGRTGELIALCEAAFGEPFAAAWEQVGPGLHVIAEVAGRPVAHAQIVDRRLYQGHEADLAMDVGYIESVATRPDAQRQGHATEVMRRVGEIIVDEYSLGGLATGSNAFYERLGWETWRGPVGVRMPDGERVRDAHEDGHVMVLRTPRSPAGLSIDAPVYVDWRPGNPW
jgi:aminoglycoside 2'-N-acetyltransferase I